MNALSDDVRAALRPHLETLDATFASVGTELIDEGWTRLDVADGLNQLLNLSRGEDCCYDRQSIGASYVLYYGVQRVVDAITVLGPGIEAWWARRHDRPLRLVDLGCGVGATAWAIRLLAMALTETRGAATARIWVDGYDSSPFMIDAAKRLWCAPHDRSLRVDATFSRGAWADIIDAEDMSTALVGGFLLDSTDSRYAGSVAHHTAALADRVGARRLVFWLAEQKTAQLERVQAELPQRWRSKEIVRRCIDVPSLGRCHAARTRWYDTRLGEKSDQSWLWKAEPKPRGSVTAYGWDTDSDEARGGIAPATQVLDGKQRAAAVPGPGPVFIVGSAGSGKSLVLAHRVAATAKDRRSKILVTTFNRSLIKRLADDVIAASAGSADDLTGVGADADWSVSFVNGSSVRLVNRDKLPTRVFGIAPSAVANLERHWTSEVARRRKEWLEDSDRQHLIDLERRVVDSLGVTLADWLADEFERVIVGRSCSTVDAYGRREVRRGRRASPRLFAAERPAVWKVLMGEDGASPIDSHSNQRRVILRREHDAIRAGQRVQPRTDSGWTHVFVDESQDFLAPELDLLACLPPTPAGFCAAGDACQAVHLGTSYERRGTVAGQRWKSEHVLAGTYRMTQRMAEALKPLAEAIGIDHAAVNAGANEADEQVDSPADAAVVSGEKSAVIGCRPIVVSDTPADITAVLRAYSGWRSGRLLAVDLDESLSGTLRETNVSRSLDDRSVFDCKGLEWATVIVSNLPTKRDPDDIDEFMYTAMTRATSLLLIVIARGHSPRRGRAIARLRRDRLLFWNDEAMRRFADLKAWAEA